MPQEKELDFAYWSINGEKRLNESETYGLLQAFLRCFESFLSFFLPG